MMHTSLLKIADRVEVQLIDITQLSVDVIVNAANNELSGGGGVDGAIHKAAGPELLKECLTLNGCDTGQAKHTKAYNLKADYIIHTVGPVWQDGSMGEATLLAGCYQEALQLAKRLGAETIAFPLISTGAYGYPLEQAVDIALSSIKDFLEKNTLPSRIIIACRSETTYAEVLSKLEKFNR